MLSLSPHRAASRPVIVGIGLALIASTMLIAPVGASHQPFVELAATGPDGVIPLETSRGRYAGGDVEGNIVSATTPTGWGRRMLQAFVVDACDVAGGAILIGVNANPFTVELQVVDSKTDAARTFELPAGPDGASAFFFDNAVDCPSPIEPNVARFPPLRGTAMYTGNRRCGQFEADVELSESKPGAGYDTFGMGSNRHRIRNHGPVVTTDTSKLFDETHILFAPDPNDLTMLQGITFSGRQGTLPKPRNLEQRIDQLTITQDPAVLQSETARVADGKKANQVAKQLGYKGGPCFYSVSAELEDVDQSDMTLLHEMSHALGMPLQPLPGSNRFEAEAVSTSSSFGLEAAALSGDGFDASAVPLTFFVAPDDGDLLQQVIDGCAINGHFWVFAAASTNVEYDLAVTDTQSGAVWQDALPSGAALPAITDTQAFATCP